jgi:peptidoglycan lytic transglycosylase G
VAAKKRPKRKSLGRVLVSLATYLLILLALAGGAALYGRTAFEAPGPSPEPRIFAIERGMRTPDIARELKRAGIISNEKIFLAAAYLTGKYRQMKAGEYQFEKHVSMASVMGLIVSGRELVFKLSVPEGWTTAQVIERVSTHESLTGDITQTPPEGAILPDTYVFRRGMTRDALLQQMRTAQGKLLDDMWAKRATDLPFTTKEEALTLASIVEKETAIAAERPQVAAVFINRLRAGMRLQSDPTIIYGITKGKTKLERPILKSDIEQTTPYNTYRIAGLPPTPIDNPGKESIAAVLNPIDSKALYFVADGSGGHVFAETLDEHHKNVRKWRVVEKTLAEEDEEPSPTPAANPASLAVESPEALEPPAMDEMAPAESSDYDAPLASEQENENAAAGSSAPAGEAPPPYVPRRLVEVAGKRVPIPLKRPKKG